MSEVAYSLQQVAKRHSGAFALSVDELQVARGEILCLVGPTGAGKSTLLRLLSGLDVPTSGRIEFFGTEHKSGAWPLAELRRIATVPQRPLHLADSVRYNIEVGLRARRVRRQGDRVRTVLEQLQIAHLAGQSARTLSGGQTQLVALARALVLEPEVLLLDEPTANLDPAHVGLVEQVLHDQHERTGMTSVWATHNLFQARRCGQRTALFLGGSLVELAATARFFDQPANPRTADFVAGRMVY
jgi:tungstate transport system ATP-binding protein